MLKLRSCTLLLSIALLAASCALAQTATTGAIRGVMTDDSGAIVQNYATGATITISVQTAAAGCTTSPADVNIVVQYRMQ